MNIINNIYNKIKSYIGYNQDKQIKDKSLKTLDTFLPNNTISYYKPIELTQYKNKLPHNLFRIDVIKDVLKTDEVWKGFLQTIFQRKGMEALKYVTIEKRVNEFVCVAVLDNIEVSIGFGKTKKEAEKQAAFNFFINKINSL